VELILNNFIAKDSSGKVLTSVNELRSSVDLKQPFTVKETVKFVTDPQSQPIFSLDNYKQSGSGDLIAGLMIDNTEKVVKSVNFSIEMPDYFRIESVISAFDGGFATVQQTGLINGYRKYDVQLTAKTAWPANLSTDNPKTFLVDNFKFTDLDYGDLKLKLSNISAKDGSGAVVNATKSLDWTISTKPIFSRFKKGDSDYNFGNGKVDLQDLQRLADYLAGKLPNRSLYQFWAFDYNGDGLVNQKDLTDMSRDLGVSGVDEEELAKLNFNITSFGELKFNHDSDLVKDLELSVYTPTGSLVYQGKLNDQSRLPESIANGPYYWRLSSQFGNVLIIR
jgi:Ca2+-binding EF-hand superfamily protein